MDLTLGQRYALQEMGIPVWELREQPAEKVQFDTPIELADDSRVDDALNIDHADCLIVIDEQYDNDPAKQKLLDFILHAIQIPKELVAVLTSQQFESLQQTQNASTKPAFFILFGQRLAELWVDGYQVFDHHLGQACQLKNTAYAAFLSENLSTLLLDPNKKYSSWLSLNMARDYYQSLHHNNVSK